MLVSKVDMLEVEVVIVEIFDEDKEEETRMVCNLEIFHREAEEVITMAILVRMEDLLVDLLMAKVF